MIEILKEGGLSTRGGWTKASETIKAIKAIGTMGLCRYNRTVLIQWNSTLTMGRVNGIVTGVVLGTSEK